MLPKFPAQKACLMYLTSHEARGRKVLPERTAIRARLYKRIARDWKYVVLILKLCGDELFKPVGIGEST